MRHTETGVDLAKLEQAQRMLAEAFGEDSDEALVNSASRFARWQEKALSAPREAYRREEVKLFPVEEDNQVSLVTIKATSFSACEHHYAPAWLKATIGYIPHESFIGYSKIVKMFRFFASRYTMDERLCNEFVREFREVVAPRGIGIILRGKHFCVISRGGLESDFPTITALWGDLQSDPNIRSEFHKHGFASWEDGV
jgi:GTP cyclohydrolase I